MAKVDDNAHPYPDAQLTSVGFSTSKQEQSMLNILNKSLAALCLASAVALTALPVAAQSASPTPQAPMFLEDTSPANFPRTIEVFKEEVKASGWSILSEHNMAGILSTKGYTLHPVVVIEVCSGKYSARLLAKDEYRYVVSMIPCRVAIYQTSTGKVVISRLNTEMFAGMMSGEVAEVMRLSGSEMEGVIKKTLARLKQK
jgi:uncharacterized protein (DUF302 family)